MRAGHLTELFQKLCLCTGEGPRHLVPGPGRGTLPPSLPKELPLSSLKLGWSNGRGSSEHSQLSRICANSLPQEKEEGRMAVAFLRATIQVSKELQGCLRLARGRRLCEWVMDRRVRAGPRD